MKTNENPQSSPKTPNKGGRPKREEGVNTYDPRKYVPQSVLSKCWRVVIADATGETLYKKGQKDVKGGEIKGNIVTAKFIIEQISGTAPSRKDAPKANDEVLKPTIYLPEKEKEDENDAPKIETPDIKPRKERVLKKR